jgi:hypothetical protein
VSATAGRAQPWSLSDVRLAVPTSGVAIVLLVWGWWVSSGAAKVSDAVPGVVIGVVAVLAIAGSAVSWVAAGRRAIRLRRVELMQAIESLEGIAQPATPDKSMSLVAVPGSPRFHRADCLLVRGKKVEQMPDGVRLVRHRTPCEMCEP